MTILLQNQFENLKNWSENLLDDNNSLPHEKKNWLKSRKTWSQEVFFDLRIGVNDK